MTRVPTIAARAGTVTARAPAKLNLQLSVGPLRDDGFHSLVTVFHGISLYDEVTVGAADQTTVLVTGEGADLVPKGPANLAARAVSAFARAAGRPGRGGGRARRGVRIEIRKRIPVAAGLAGGSADAAAVLVACNELWHAGATPGELSKIGASIGSDVPFALTGGTAVGQGRGEVLTRVLASGSYHWVLAFASGGLSTAEVYAACDRLRAARPAAAGRPARPAERVGEPKLSTALMSALRAGDPAEVGPLLANDLQPAALSLLPVLRRALSAGRDLGALGAVVSGSGPTCAFLAADAVQARDLAVALTGAGVCRAVACVAGPAPGAGVMVPGRRG